MKISRKKKMETMGYDPSLLIRRDKWIASQELPPSKVSVHELALKEFLDKRNEI